MNEQNRGIALVTGGSGGIGAACCKALGQSGFKVAIHYNRGQEQADALKNSIPNSFLIQADISTVEGMDSIYETLRKDHGGDLSVLVNNAGVAIDNPIFTATLEEFQKTMDINVRSTWYLTKRLSRLMIRKKWGRIINISSVVGSHGNVSQSIYGMTKAAIDNLTKSASKEFAQYNILVNSVAPGFIQTSMTEKIPDEFREYFMRNIPLGRMGTPEEVAEVVQFLAASGNYCTGSVFHVNGGMYGG